MPFIRAIEVLREQVASPRAYPFSIPALREVERLELDRAVTFFVGENGSGKSTLVEAIAVAAGLNPEGGSGNFNFSTRASHSALHEALRIVRGIERPRTSYFLRAESFFNVATVVDALEREQRGLLDASYGGTSLHEQSHGESFLALVNNRFGDRGLYVLDEPEAALSVRGCLALLARMRELAETSQFVIATHSPLLLAYPGARIYALDETGIEQLEYEDTEQYQLTRAFLEDRERFFRHLFG